VCAIKHAISCPENESVVERLQSENAEQAEEIRSLIVENQRLIHKLEDADRETRYTAIATHASEEQLRPEITRLQECPETFESPQACNIEKLTRLLIQGRIESVTSMTLPGGSQRIVVTGDDGDASLGSPPGDPEWPALALDEEFTQLSTENEELKEQVRDLQEQVGRLMKAQVQSLAGELEIVEAENHNLRSHSFTLEALVEENTFLRHRVVALESQNLDAQFADPISDVLRRRSIQLESILEGFDNSSAASDDRLEDDSAAMAACQEENTRLRREVEELRERAAADACRANLEAEVTRLITMKDDVADSLEEQIDYLHSTVEALASERDELQARVCEQAKIIQSFDTRFDSGELASNRVVPILTDCLAIVKTSQIESSRAYDELRLLHHQLHTVEDENAELKHKIVSLKRQIHSDDE
jgi:chromosome segregation ATPase